MDCDVSIIGCGPVGALLGNLLGQKGHSVHLIEKQPKPYDLPRAIHFDGEVMRIFQSAGLTDAILPSTMIGRGMLFKDMEGNVLIDWSRAQEIGPMGWYESYRFHQPGVESALLDGLDRFPNVCLTRGESVVAVSEEAGRTMLRLSNGNEITSQYVVGCDGASSFLRETLNMGVEDLGFNERWLVIDLMLRRQRDDLGDYSIQYCDESDPATYVRGVGDRRRWELRLRTEEPDQISDDFVWQKLRRWIGPDDAEIERSAVYTFRSCVARRWRSGSFLLAGDAAHQMPPFMGQGMCAGMRDIANLWWKLDQVLRGASPALLDTYQSERDQHVRQFIELTLRLGKLINQTAVGNAPRGVMKSIWPSLGEGFGRRDGVGGKLAPQVRLEDGILADDMAGNGFYLLATSPMEAPIPVVVGAWELLEQSGFKAALIRPDGYAVAGIDNIDDALGLIGRTEN